LLPYQAISFNDNYNITSIINKNEKKIIKVLYFKNKYKSLEEIMPKSNKKTKKNIKRTALIFTFILAILFLVSGSVFAYQVYIENTSEEYTESRPDDGSITIMKPVIYLYPTKTEDVSVKLFYDGKLTSTYPDYNKTLNGWDVTAKTDGSLINHADGLAYSYLFWEGKSKTDYSKFDTGFVVTGYDTKSFLQKTLKDLGLTAKEYNEMIVFWLPKMENNKYNLIHFAGKDYTDGAKLSISPAPDSILRVFMVYKAVDKYQQIKPQTISSFERKGFTVVEWGGTEVK
jgi:hypothetical protein